MILVKLGGSVITDKQAPLTPRPDAVRRIAGELAGLGEPLVLVHGGGSFGHYWSVRYGMHTKPAPYDLRGVATVKNSMVTLNGIVLDALLEGGLSPYCVPPSAIISVDAAVPSRVVEVSDMAESGLTPVTYGDAVWGGGGTSYILSGDRIMGLLARIMRPRLSVFILGIDGLYRDMESESLIGVAGGQDFSAADVDMDVTGGMRRKVQEASGMAADGLDVAFVNGTVPGRIADAVKRKKFRGTLFPGRKR